MLVDVSLSVELPVVAIGTMVGESKMRERNADSEPQRSLLHHHQDGQLYCHSSLRRNKERIGARILGQYTRRHSDHVISENLTLSSRPSRSPPHLSHLRPRYY